MSGKERVGFAVKVLIACAASVAGAAVDSPKGLTVGEGFVNPLGFYDATPTFSWKLPKAAKAQSAYQVVVAGDAGHVPDKPDLWDSGKVASDQSVWIPYGGKPLQSRQRLTWQARFWDEQGHASEWSEPARVEMGLLHNSDWQGKWIRMGSASAEPSQPAPKIVVLKALYGAPGKPAQQVDVTEKVKALLASGSASVTAENRLTEKDPAYHVVKTLELDYTVDGKAARTSVKENDTFSFVPGAGNSKGKKFVPEYFRRTFTLAEKVAQARLRVTAKGLYEIHINGSRVGGDYMAPGWTPYQARIETLTYDVTAQLRAGENAIGAMIGEGWYAGDMMSKKFVYPEAKPALLAQLEVDFADGRKQIIATDERWSSCNRGPLRYSNIYHGEEYDAKLEMHGWSNVGFDASAWLGSVAEALDDKVMLVPKRHNAVRATGELPALKVTEPAPGRYVFDLGQNMVGWPRLKMPVENGGQVTIRFAEMLEKDGTLYTANYRSARSTLFYTAAATGTVTWHPTFTFFGFRYVELSGLPAGAKPAPDWVTGVVLHSDFAQSGRFSSSHEKLNQLQRNITWGQRGNFLDIPTDCPQRNERLGWTGDAQVFCPTSFFNYDVLSFWMSWLQSVREDQTSAGLIGHTVPSTGCGAGSPGWGDVGVTAPWDVYVRTGHRAVLEENYDMMKKWTAAYEREAKDFIVARKGFGDWLQPYPKGKDNRADTPMAVIATAYFGRCAGILRSAARVLGQDEDAAHYDALFANIQKAFSKTFFDGNGKMTTEFKTQTGYLMALGYDLLLPELRQGALDGLLEQLGEADGHLRTGFLGTPLIAPVLDRFGHLDQAYSVLFKETYPSWFYSINQGATTMWERWNSYSHTDGFGNAGMNSFNHYAYGAIGQWMYERMAGLAPDPKHPGYKHFFLQPNPGGPLTAAEAELETPYGKAVSGWKRSGKGLTVHAVVPPNTTATLVVPSAGSVAPEMTEDGQRCAVQKRDGVFVYEVGPGEHTFAIKSVTQWP